MNSFRWHEQEFYKNLYEAELSILKRGLKGDFELTKLYAPDKKDRRVKAIGTLSFDKNKRQDIQIIFPTKYPYASPKIISINISKDAKGNIIENFPPLNFGKGNQYIDGSLCLYREDYWDKDLHNIGFVLRRAQKWLKSANSKGGFKLNEIVEELPAPMAHIGQVLFPKDYIISNNAKTGQFSLTQFKPNYYILEHNVLSVPVFQLTIGVEVFKWYSFNKGITFKKLFPKFDVNVLNNVFLNHFGENMLDGTNKNIALYLPDDPNPWHFFKISIQKIGNNINVSVGYLISRNISKELYLRTKDIFDDQILLQKKVTIIGLGAIGSEVAKSLAKNGVGHFNLFDKDIFEIGNSIRHAADLYYIGEDKVNVVKKLILRSNPNITVNGYKVDILNDTGLFEQSLNDSDLCIVLTAEDSVDYMINDHYLQNSNITYIFARVSAGGFSGSIQIINKETPCLRCLSAKGLDILPKPKRKLEFDELSPEYGSCSNPALPGSEIDTKEIAMQVTRVSLQVLLKGEKSIYPKLKHKQFFWHGPCGSTKKAPFTWEMKNIKRVSDCKVCKK